MKAILFMLPLIAAVLVGYVAGRRAKRLSSPEREDLKCLRKMRDTLTKLAANNAATEPFAMIVLDEVNKSYDTKEIEK